MVDSQRKPVRNYLRRREQWRLLGLVLALGLVVILMNEVRKTANWRWFAALSGNEDQPPVQPVAGPPPDVRKDPALDGIFELTPEQSETIQDDTVWLREEREAWFRLLKILRQNDQSSLEGQSEGPVTYTQLFAQSGAYRGKLVTLKGIVRRANPVPTPKNDDGFDNYWQLWLSPTDNPNSPIVVYCLDLPKGFPVGMEEEADVELTGFFFKRWAYNAWDPYRKKSSLVTAPAVLAKTVTWHPPLLTGKDETVTVDARFFITIIVVAIISSFLVVLYVHYKTRRDRPEEPETAVNLDSLLRSETLSKNGAAAKLQTTED